jgi:glycosyltransferase involved in cell wall biosynthesis
MGLGIQVAIEAAALRVHRGDGAPHFVDCGDRPEFVSFYQLAAEPGLDLFHLLGRREDSTALLGSAIVAARVPLVASRVGAIPEPVEEGKTGWLVTPGDAEALVPTLRRVLDEPVARCSIRAGARTRADRQYPIERVPGELEKLPLAVAAE